MSGGPAPTVVAHVADLLFSSRIAETARRLGYRFQAARSLGDLRAALEGRPALVMLDLTASGLDQDAALREIDAAGRPAPVLGWTTHVLWKETKPLHGRCDRVVTREKLTEELPDLLRGYVEGRPGMDAEAFVRDLDARNQELLRRLTPESTLKPEVEGDLTVVNLLKVALRNEIEATESAARWMATTPEIDVKLALARQVGDEAKHYRLVADRLLELGFDTREFNPLSKGYGPLFQYLESLQTTVERVAAGQFTREAIAVVKNRQFIEFCEAVGDGETARLYRDVIEPDERHHHELGRRLLLRYATTPEAQEAARRAATRTLELAEELQG
ncbi:MAG: ferritin-like domain-containing protein, partial [Candidatus Rokuibacteriota bacterium]